MQEQRVMIERSIEQRRSSPPRWPPTLSPMGILSGCLGGGILIFTLLLPETWTPNSMWRTEIVYLHVLLLGGVAVVLGAGLVVGRHHQPVGFHWACSVLLVGNLLTVLGDTLGLPAPQPHATSALAMILHLAPYIVFYSMGQLGLAFLVPLGSLPRSHAIRLALDTMLVMASANVALRILLPLLLVGWTWNPDIQASVLRLVMTIGLCYWYGSVYRRFGAFDGAAVVVWAIGLGCMLVADILLLGTTYLVMNGANPQIISAFAPFGMLHQFCWALGLYWSSQTRMPWRDEPAHHQGIAERFPWFAPARRGLVPVLVAMIMFVRSVSMSVTVAFVILLASHEALAVYERNRLVRLQRAAQEELVAANQKLRAYAAQAEALAMTEERNRIAREIHDGLGHYLTAIMLQLKGARSVFDTHPVSARESLEEAYQSAKNALQEVRCSVGALREPSVSQLPLPQGLAELIKQSSTAGVRTTFTQLGTPRALPSPITYALYRVVQEGLTNARKHAEHAHVRVQLDYRQLQHVRIVIEDDGPGTNYPEGGFGLVGLRERIERIGGTVTIQTALGQGFRLQIEVPDA